MSRSRADRRSGGSLSASVRSAAEAGVLRPPPSRPRRVSRNAERAERHEPTRTVVHAETPPDALLQSTELATRGDCRISCTARGPEAGTFHGLRERSRAYGKTLVEFSAELANRCAFGVETLIGKELAELSRARSRDSARVAREIAEAASAHLHTHDGADCSSREHE